VQISVCKPLFGRIARCLLCVSATSWLQESWRRCSVGPFVLAPVISTSASGAILEGDCGCACERASSRELVLGHSTLSRVRCWICYLAWRQHWWERFVGRPGGRRAHWRVEPSRLLRSASALLRPPSMAEPSLSRSSPTCLS
jgi:hypothetical protein